MAKKWTWAILSAIWLSAAILNYFDRRSGMLVLFNLEAAAIFLLLTICQCICDKRGAAGEKNIDGGFCAASSKRPAHRPLMI